MLMTTEQDFQERLAYLMGHADPETELVVLGKALTSPVYRAHLYETETLAESLPDEAIPTDPAFTARANRLRERLLSRYDPPDSVRETIVEGVIRVVGEVVEEMVGAVRQALTTGRHVLTLPCLAPAAAASPDDLSVPRQTITTAEGVRIEFQQLPGLPVRLRSVVDASGMVDFAPERYDACYLTLAETGSEPPPRHIVVVRLNREGKGFVDVTMGAGTDSLPSPQGVCQFVGATLTRV